MPHFFPYEWNKSNLRLIHPSKKYAFDAPVKCRNERTFASMKIALFVFMRSSIAYAKFEWEAY